MFELVGYAVLWPFRRVFGGRLAPSSDGVFAGAYTREGGYADFAVGLIATPVLGIASLFAIGGLINLFN